MNENRKILTSIAHALLDILEENIELRDRVRKLEEEVESNRKFVHDLIDIPSASSELVKQIINGNISINVKNEE